MVELKGSLTDIGLQSIVQLIGDMHHTGRLELSGSKTQAVLGFEDGRLVAAECREDHGLQALGTCVVEIPDADFVFVEGPVTLEHTLDLGASDLNKLLGRIGSEQFNQSTNGVTSADETQARTDAVCPMLGFADDRARHYSRPTALHRCYAAGPPSLVTSQEQRDLCLGDRFPTCPRFRNADHATTAAEPPPLAVGDQQVSAAPVPVPPVPPPRMQPSPIAPDHTAPPSAPPPGRMPPRVAARMTAASQLHMPPAAPREPPTELPARVGPQIAPAPEDGETERGRSPSRRLIVGGVVGGLLLAGLATFLVLAVARPAAAPRQTAPAVEPAATAPLVPVSVAAARASAAPASPTAVPTQAAVATAARPAVPAPVQPTAVAAVGRALVDVRLAAGPQARWVDNAPYATWSDGAYRLQARDATRFVAVDVPIDQPLTDAVVSATFRKTGGPPGGGYGLILRDSGGVRDGQNQEFNAYVFEAGDVGEYGVWRREGDHWIDMVPWTRSAVVRSGGSPNELVVRAVGTQLSFTVNGVELANLQDDALQSGSIGLFVGGDNNAVALDRFNVSLPN